VADSYNDQMQKVEPEQVVNSSWKNDGSLENKDFVPSDLYITDERGEIITGETQNNTDKWLVIKGEVMKESSLYTIGFQIKNSHKSLLFMSFSSDMSGPERPVINKGMVTLRCKIPARLLNEGLYRISIIAGIHNKYWILSPEDRTPTIELFIKGKLSDSEFWKTARSGILAPVCSWEIL
jgi:lipopolysaccharide transport system ATP-binding protein